LANTSTLLPLDRTVIASPLSDVINNVFVPEMNKAETLGNVRTSSPSAAGGQALLGR
jgi:hypothetical protein